jgi:uncharacterized protein YcfJ
MRAKIKAAIIVGIFALIAAVIGGVIGLQKGWFAPEKDDSMVNLNFRDWSSWPQAILKASPNKNTVTINGKVDTAGYVNEHINRNMKNKTVTLSIQNASNSQFSNHRMLKITVN